MTESTERMERRLKSVIAETLVKFQVENRLDETSMVRLIRSVRESLFVGDTDTE